MSTSGFSRGVRIVARSLALAGVAGLLVLGCGQGEGDRCEIDSDCNDGKCEVTNGNGICRANPTPVTIPVIDAAQPNPPTPDAAAPAPDAADAATAPDAAVDHPADAADAADGAAHG